MVNHNVLEMWKKGYKDCVIADKLSRSSSSIEKIKHNLKFEFDLDVELSGGNGLKGGMSHTSVCITDINYLDFMLNNIKYLK
jgi:hypothetical protein